MALKALYLCQNEAEFGRCGSLTGYLAGRPLSASAQAEAKALIAAAASKTVVPPSSSSFSTLNAMVNNQFQADVEDYFPIPLPTPTAFAYAGLRYAAVKSGVWRYEPCSKPGEGYINSEPTKYCRANPVAISDLTYKFLNANANEQSNGLKLENVCDHYRQRYEHQIRRSVFVDLKCADGAATSEVRGKQHNLERKIRFDADGRLTAIEFRSAAQPEATSIMEFKDGKPTLFSNYMYGNADRLGRRTARWDASKLNTEHPYYTELARLKLEVKEIISCCRETDETLKVRCKNALSTPAGAATAQPGGAEPATR